MSWSEEYSTKRPRLLMDHRRAARLSEPPPARSTPCTHAALGRSEGRARGRHSAGKSRGQGALWRQLLARFPRLRAGKALWEDVRSQPGLLGWAKSGGPVSRPGPSRVTASLLTRLTWLG